MRYTSKSDLEGMTVAVLKQLCKAQGIGVSGNKEELVARCHFDFVSFRSHCAQWKPIEKIIGNS